MWAGARIVRGIHEFAPTKVFSCSVVIARRPGSTYIRIVELKDSTVYRFNREQDGWPNLRSIQILMISDTSALAYALSEADRAIGSSPEPSESNRFSTIHEGSHEDYEDDGSQDTR